MSDNLAAERASLSWLLRENQLMGIEVSQWRRDGELEMECLGITTNDRRDTLLAG
jgi:hypothetical protein